MTETDSGIHPEIPKKEVPPVYLLNEMLPRDFTEIHLLGLENDRENRLLVENGIDSIAKLHDTDPGELFSWGIRGFRPIKIKERTNKLIALLEMSDIDIDEIENANQKAIANGELPQHILDPRLREWGYFTEIDLITKSIRIHDRLVRNGIWTLYELDNIPEEELTKKTRIGEKTARDAKAALQEFKEKHLQKPRN